MSGQEPNDVWPVLEENDPPLDLSREEAAFERERARLVRDHLGHVALIRGDEVVGAFPTADEAITEGHRRFGLTRFVCRPITETDEPEWMPYVDITHPSLGKRRLPTPAVPNPFWRSRLRSRPGAAERGPCPVRTTSSRQPV
jgi:hypothetical protein